MGIVYRRKIDFRSQLLDQFHPKASSHPWMKCLCSAMAGNIIPAIATTNAVIAGLIVLEGLKILSGQLESCRTVSFVSD